MGDASEDRAFLLARHAFRERDWIVKLLTEKHGKISAIARGARGSRKRFGGSLDFHQLIAVELRLSRGEMQTLNGATTLHSNADVTADLLCTSIAAVATETVSKLCPDNQVETETFEALCTFYELVGTRPWHALVALEIAALDSGGLLPSLACELCGTVGDKSHLSLQLGQIHCVRCRAQALGPFVAISPQAGQGLVLSEGGGEGEFLAAHKVLSQWITLQIGSALKSERFLRQMAGLAM